MSRVAINTGSVANDGTGDSLRIAGGIINDNFSEIYSQFGDGTDLTPTWDKTTAGINTTSSVGIGTTNPRFTLEVGAVGSSGTSLYVNGNARVTGILTVGSSSIILDGNANKILVGSGISFDGNTGIISATAFYAGGSIISGGAGGGLNYWGSGASGISTTANVAIGTVTPTSKLTVVGNSLFSGIATFRSNLTLANITSSSNTLRFGSNSYIDQSNNDVVTFQINSGIDGAGTDSSFVFRSTEPGTPDQQYDALRVYSGGNYWNRLVRVYTNFHADNNAFVGGDLQVGAASTLIGAGSTLGSFKVGAGGTVITTTSTGLVGIGTTNPTSALTVKGNTSLETLNVSGVSTFNNEVVFTRNGSVNPVDQVVINDDTEVGPFIKAGSASFYFNSPNTIIRNTFSGGRIRMDSPSGIDFEQYGLGGAYRARFDNTNVSLYSSDSLKFQTIGTGITVTGTTFTNQLSVSGVGTVGTVGASSTTLVVNGYAKIDGIDINGKSSTNTHIGKEAGKALTGGQQNVALGMYALLSNVNSNFNTAVGMSALRALGSDPYSAYNYNTALGALAGHEITSGLSNTLLGASAGYEITTGSHNTIVGRYDGNSNGLDIRNSSSNVVLSDGTGNIRFYSNSSGDVGIGTTNATSKLTVRGGDISVGVNTAHGIILTSPNGTEYRLIVADDGTLSTTAV